MSHKKILNLCFLLNRVNYKINEKSSILVDNLY